MSVAIDGHVYSDGPRVKHFDIRYVCPKTGQLEATEDSWLTFKKAYAVLVAFGDSGHTVVECDEPANSRAHDVDVSYFEHIRDHEGYTNEVFSRMVGVPTHFDENEPYNGWEA